jgi:hypothetical protein
MFLKTGIILTYFNKITFIVDILYRFSLENASKTVSYYNLEKCT